MLDQWPCQFPGCEPIAHQLRVAFADRWVRFHSLPGSKRYPESEDDYAVLLARHNWVLRDLTEPGQPVVLLTTSYSAMSEPVERPSELQRLDPCGVPWRSAPMHELEGAVFSHPTYWHVFASMWQYKPNVFNAIVRLVADDKVANVMMVAPDCRWLLHPYDGGMDVIAESPAARDRCRLLHPDWLSPRPDGM